MKRRHILIVGIILAIGLVLGSIFDLQISQSLLFKGNIFSIVCAIIGEFALCGGLSFFGGVIVIDSKKYIFNKFWSIAFFIGGFIYFIVAGAYFGIELMSADALGRFFPGLDKLYISIPIGLGLIVPTFFLGFHFSDMIDHVSKFNALVALSFALVAALVVTLSVKYIMCRPRFIYINEFEHEYLFRNWWQRFGNRDYYMSLDDVDSDMFRSLPSGHACYSMCGLIPFTYLYLFNEKLEKRKVLIFYIVVGCSFAISFSRILAGMHYLSDVCIGGLIGLVCYYIVNDIIQKYILKK